MEPRTHRLTEEFAEFNRAVALLIEHAKRDLAADGLNPATAHFVLELDMLYGGQFHVKRTLSPRTLARSRRTSAPSATLSPRNSAKRSAHSS